MYNTKVVDHDYHVVKGDTHFYIVSNSDFTYIQDITDKVKYVLSRLGNKYPYTEQKVDNAFGYTMALKHTAAVKKFKQILSDFQTNNDLTVDRNVKNKDGIYQVYLKYTDKSRMELFLGYTDKGVDVFMWMN